MQQACFLQLKSFGDFVIAAQAAGRVVEEDRSRLSLAMGDHLRPLCDAITPAVRVIEIRVGEGWVPSIFDIRKRSVPRAVRSALHLRREVARAPIPRDATLLFDNRFGWRERFIIGRRPVRSMPAGAANIYFGYDALLEEAGFRLSPAAPQGSGAPTRIGIFPGSRLAAKNLPVDLVRALLEALGPRYDATLFLLNGERPDLEAAPFPSTIVERNFPAMCRAVGSVDTVISADSLPAHLAERAGARVFVFTPRPNEFWMPPSVLTHHRWALFDDAEALGRVQAMLAA